MDVEPHGGMRTSERKKQTERRLGIGRVSEALALLQGNARVQPSKQPNSDANGRSPRFPHVILRHAPDEAFPVTEPWNCDRLLSRLSSLRTLIIFFFLLPLSSPPSLLPGLYIPWSSWRVALDPCSTTPPPPQGVRSPSPQCGCPPGNGNLFVYIKVLRTSRPQRRI